MTITLIITLHIFEVECFEIHGPSTTSYFLKKYFFFYLNRELCKKVVQERAFFFFFLSYIIEIKTKIKYLVTRW